ncbi:large ribosomal subunit protein bL9m [Microcaecilia unicolor]|uniref:Large ribosomal subunit protein bL9m n=1 Tax=Microcaecilia unicolor TaxID=1415580 RepID=A0A6P7WUI1_9AMPH|nr:39S ribosomal protein L9, mitochondrial [Microcaecilia unicolor]
MLIAGRILGAVGKRSVCLTQSRGTVVVERWWQVPLAAEGKEPYLHPRRHRIYRFLEDTKHKPKGKLELILTQTVEKLGERGDSVFVRKAQGRNKLLPQGLAVYASPENKKLFQEEKRRLYGGKPGEQIQTRTGELTLKFLRNCHLEVGISSTEAWELTKEIVCRNFLKNLGVFVPPHALTLPDERITQWGEYWCEVTVNGIDSVRIPMFVVTSAKPQTKSTN